MEITTFSKNEALHLKSYELSIPEGLTPRIIRDQLTPSKFDPELNTKFLKGILSTKLSRYEMITGQINNDEIDKPIKSGKVDVNFFTTTPSTFEEIKTKIKNELGNEAELADLGTALYIMAEKGAEIMNDYPQVKDSYYVGRRIAIDAKDDIGNKSLIVDFINKQPRLASFEYIKSEKFSKALVIIRK